MKKCNRLLTLISSVFIMMSVSAYGDDPLSSEELEEYISDNAQAIVDAGEERAALQRQFDKKLAKGFQVETALNMTSSQLKDKVEQFINRLVSQ